MNTSWGNIAYVHGVDKLKAWDSWKCGEFKREAIRYNGKTKSSKKPPFIRYRVEVIKKEISTSHVELTEIVAIDRHDAQRRAFAYVSNKYKNIEKRKYASDTIPHYTLNYDTFVTPIGRVD